MEITKYASASGKPIRCKAAVARKAGEPLVLEEIEVLAPKAWEVRIKILCTSLCHTDVTMWKLDNIEDFTFFPIIFGHEAAGVVESVGEHVEEVKEGDLVIPVFQRNCGECRDCVSEEGNACSKFPKEFWGGMPRDGTTRFVDRDGNPIHHFFSVSSFSEYTVVDITHVVKISRGFPVHKASLLSCGVTTGKKFGVTDFINPSSCTEKSVCQVIQEMSDGGADYCFECIGLASMMQDAFNSCRPGRGMTVVLGVERHGEPLSINTSDLLRGKTICGCLLGGMKPKSDIPILAKRYLDKELNLDEFISHEIKFEDINTAFDLLQQGLSLRCMIWMDK